MTSILGTGIETTQTSLSRTFTCFDKLPNELRIKIYEEAIMLWPRIVEVCQLQEESELHSKALSVTSDVEDLKDLRANGVEGEVDYAAQDFVLGDGNVEGCKMEEVEELGKDGVSNDGDDKNEVEMEEEENEDDEMEDDEEEDNNEDVAEDNQEEEAVNPNPNPFFTHTALPPLFYVSHESRQVALQHYPLSFPNPPEHPATIRYNPSIDTLYFSASCFEDHIYDFESTLSPTMKDSIRRIAIDNLIWNSYPEDGTLNDQIHLDVFKNLEEITLTSRKVSLGQCGCCHEFHGRERGAVTFDNPRGMHRPDNGHLSEYDMYEMSCLRTMNETFDEISARDESWHRPDSVRFVDLLRDGKLL